MHRMWNALASMYRRWKYVEENSAVASMAMIPSEDNEPLRTRRAIERRQQLLTDYRRNGCAGLARECETTIRSLRTRLAVLES